MKRLFFVRVLPWLVVLVGAGAIYLGVDDTLQARASLEWPSVQGTVVRSTIERVVSTSGTSRSTTYRARVAYEYPVAGTKHEGDRISYGHYDTESESDAARVVAKYPVGNAVTVRYRPTDPRDAVLETGSAGLPWLYLGIGIPFVLVGVVLAVVAPRLAASS